MEAEKHQEGGGAVQSPREREEEYINHPSAVLCSAMQCCPGSTWSHAGSLENCFKLRTREMRGRFGSV